jgi:hypothetical protein
MIGHELQLFAAAARLNLPPADQADEYLRLIQAERRAQQRARQLARLESAPPKPAPGALTRLWRRIGPLFALLMLLACWAGSGVLNSLFGGSA